MAQLVKFTRVYNRTAENLLVRRVMPKAEVTLADVCREIVQYCKANHSYHNQTGALEDSIHFNAPETKGQILAAEIIAGGPALGGKVYVDYAPYVEAKGFPVLRQGIERYRAIIGPKLAANMRGVSNA